MKELLNRKLIEFGKYELHVEDLVWLILVWIVTFVFLRIVRSALNRSHRLDVAKKYSIFTILRYIVVVIISVFSLQILGFNLSVLLAGSAALLVGLGLGIQALFSDYISGIIILFDSSVKVGDIVEINGLVCKVIEINLRTTTVLTRDDKYIILPNTDLTRHHLINWTHEEIKARFDVSVGVEYGADVEQVMELLAAAATEIPGISKEPVPFVRFNDFGESSLDFTVYFWTEDVFRVENTKSSLRVVISRKLREHQIEIPFPQRVIHTEKEEENPKERV